LATPFRVERGRVVTDDLSIATGDVDWLARGSVGLDGTLDYHLTALLPAAEAAALPGAVRRAVGVATGPEGRASLDFFVRGTASRPSFAWDPARTGAALLAGARQAAEARARSVETALA